MVKRRKKLTHIGFSSITQNEEWINSENLKNIFYDLGMISKYFFFKASPFFNEKYSQVNVLLTNDIIDDSAIYTSPLNKPLGLMSYSIDLNELNSLSNEKEIFAFIHSMYSSIIYTIFKSLNIDFNKPKITLLLDEINSSLQKNPKEIIKPIEDFM
jgi:hypothetical protein